MARAAVLGRLTWQPATTVEAITETATARTIVLDVEGWPGHRAGQHLDVRLTAPDGYTARRAYSIASAPAGNRVAITVQEVPGGEVSPYLVEDLRPGDRFEVRGPLGGWFVWDPDQTEPALLVAGGSGVVPLMAMARTRAATGAATPMRLVYSARSPQSALFLDEIDDLVRRQTGFEADLVWTRRTPEDWPRPPGRISADLLEPAAWRPTEQPPTSYVCGPTGFVETVADLLIETGHDPARIRTERFGPTGG